ncbi:MAG TPA: CBS domain-containing protein [Saprospiraceae bacterium]|nr:CBS domain-containing protein [Saprospiraceae bacterium]
MTIKKREQVSVIMTKQPFSVTLKNSLSEVERLLKENFIRHAPVVDGHRLIGMISKTDLERISFLEIDGQKVIKSKYYDLFTVEQVMTKSVHCIQEDDFIKDAAEILSLGSFHALPVLRDDELVGIVTSTDLINYLLKQYN